MEQDKGLVFEIDVSKKTNSGLPTPVELELWV
jgi:hypothetical protein